MTQQYDSPPTIEEIERWNRLTLTEWAALPLAELHRAEHHFWGRALSLGGPHDVPSYRRRKGEKVTDRPTKRTIAELEADRPAWTAGKPDPHWSDSELASFVAYQDAAIAAQPAAEPPIRWEQLSNAELDALAVISQPAPTKRKTIKVRK